MRAIHTWTDTTATIKVEGLAAPIRVLHVTDSHLALGDERDPERLEDCRKTHAKFLTYHKEGVPAERSFVQTLSRPEIENVHLIALTGDIVHYPVKLSVETAAKALAETGVPWMYTSGNHDWNFKGAPMTDDERRARWPLLEGLHCGGAACSVRDAGGVRFLAFDDSNYQINEEQLAFARKNLAAGLPTVVLIHIPISLATLRAPTIARWKAPILIGDPDWELSSRLDWGTRPDDKTTLEFIRLLASSPNLVAVLCGHIHFPHCDNIHPHAIQYVGKPGFEGGSRLIEIIPLG